MISKILDSQMTSSYEVSIHPPQSVNKIDSFFLCDKYESYISNNNSLFFYIKHILINCFN